MKTHSEILPRLAAFHDGALPADQRKEVETHVRQCPQCRATLDSWTALDESLKALPEPDPLAHSLKADIVRRIEIRSVPVDADLVPRPRRIPVRAWVAVAAAAAVIVTAALLLRDRGGPGQVQQPAESPAIVHTPRPEPVQPPGHDEEESATPAKEPEPVKAPEVNLAQAEESAPPHGEESVAPLATADKHSATVSDRPSAGASGIPQVVDWSARFAEFVQLHYRVPDLYEGAIVEVNLLPVYTAEFEGVGYADGDLLSDEYDISLGQPRRLSPQVAYLVSSLRMERAALMSRTTNQVRSTDVQLRLAEITWRLANLTADRDDVRSAIAAQSAVMRQVPGVSTQSLSRLAHLRSLEQ